MRKKRAFLSHRPGTIELIELKKLKPGLFDENNENDLVLAASIGHLKAVQKIIQNDPAGADRDGPRAFKKAVKYGKIEVINYFLTTEMYIKLPEGFIHSLRLIATKHQQIESLRALVLPEKIDRELEAIFHASSPSPLATDCRTEDFFNDGQSKNLELDEKKNSYPLPKITPLGLAAKLGHFEIVSYLINEEGVDVNERDAHGRTALEIAADHGQNTVVNLLLTCPHLELTPGSVNLTNLSVRNRNRIKLLEYVPERADKPDHYTSYGKRFRCNKDTKIKAANALKQYALFGTSNLADLNAHLRALTEFNSDLGKIYKVLKKR